MSKYSERAIALRGDASVHYNCAQSVVIPFAADAGLTDKQAFDVAANFGAGMKMASICGAITGGLMALGLFGLNDQDTVNAYYAALRKNHQNYLDCANLLRLNKEAGGEKKPHCDQMVYECVALVEGILREKMIITD